MDGLDGPTYFADGCARILELLKDTFGTSGPIRTYYNGELEEIPESSLPCIMVSEGLGLIEDGATGQDDITETVRIIIAMNKKDDIGAAPTDDLVEFKLRKLVKGQDPTTKEYLPQTIMYALRKHITLNDASVGMSVQTDFGPNIRGVNTFVHEAYIDVTIGRHASVPNRD